MSKDVNHFSLGGGQMRTTVRLVDFPVNAAAIAGGADLGFGVKLFGFNDDLAYIAATDIVTVTGAGFTLSLQESDGNITADTPDVGLGSVIASGAVSVLSGTATFEDIMTGQTVNDANGTAEHNYVALATPTALTGAADCYLNIADGWAASGEAAGGVVASGLVTVDWMVHTA